MKPKKIIATDTEVIEVKPLIETSVLTKKFNGMDSNIAQYIEYANSIAIKGDDTLIIAENKSKEVNEILKSVNNIHADIKAPYLATCRIIDEYKKSITDRLDKVKKIINDAIANYKVVQAAAARAELLKKQEELNKKQAEKDEEIAKLNRVQKQIIARLYGGVWFNKANIRSSSSGCLKPEHCDALVEFINESYPKLSLFKHMADDSELLKNSMMKLIARHKINLINLSSENSSIRDKALEAISQAKIAAGIKADETIEKMNVSSQKSLQKELTREERVVKSTEKGVRKILKFMITDPQAVPVSYLKVDEDKIKEFMSENSDVIKEKLQKRIDINDIPGVRFYIDDIYATT